VNVFKRLFDIAASTLGLLILSPLLLTLVLIVKLASPGPIFYRAKRVGQYGKSFYLFKFRSMVIDADTRGPGVTGAQDIRITRIGRTLRRTKLDELPQLINVLKGEMSLVGPRPEDPRYVAFYTEEQRQILNLRPGITSKASISYRNEEAMLVGEDVETYYIRHVMPVKLAIDKEYAKQATLWSDIVLILNTVRDLIVR